MFTLLIALTTVATGSAQIWSPWLLTTPYTASLVVYQRFAEQPNIVINSVVPTSSQYHAQDELGQFAFGHQGDNQARQEVKSLDGTVKGAYSYIDATGKLINVQYLADQNGFRILGANNLPVAPSINLEAVKDTPEVIEARAAFAKEFEKVKEEAAKVPEEEKSRRRREVTQSEMKTEQQSVEGKVAEDIPTVYSILSSSIYKPSLILKSETAPVDSKFVPYFSTPYLSTGIVPSIFPIVSKTTVKSSELKPVDDAKVPAATKLAEIKETEKEIVTPLAYSSPVYYSPLINPPVVSLKGIFLRP